MYRVTSALFASLLIAGTAASAATDYPTQPITVLVPMRPAVRPIPWRGWSPSR